MLGAEVGPVILFLAWPTCNSSLHMTFLLLSDPPQWLPASGSDTAWWQLQGKRLLTTELSDCSYYPCRTFIFPFVLFSLMTFLSWLVRVYFCWIVQGRIKLLDGFILLPLRPLCFAVPSYPIIPPPSRWLISQDKLGRRGRKLMETLYVLELACLWQFVTQQEKALTKALRKNVLDI